MAMLVAGVLLFTLAHLSLSVAPGIKTGLVKTLGSEAPFKGLFALVLLGALALMIFGWRSSSTVFVYDPPAWGRHAAMALMLLGAFFFFSARSKSNIKRFVRHPQLTGVAIWTLAHLLANGDSKSLVLFGGLGLWSVVEMFAISARDGAWTKPEPSPASADIIAIVVGLVAYAVLFFLHPYLAGVSLFSGF